MVSQILENCANKHDERFCAEVSPYKKLGKIVNRLRFADVKNILSREKLGDLLNLSYYSVSKIELGVRKVDLFELKDIATIFSPYSPKMRVLQLVLDTHFPIGNHSTQAIHAETGKLIYETRVSVAEITQTQLAREAGIDDSLLWRIESGSIRIYLLEVWKIARVLRDDHEGFRELDDALTDLLAQNLVVNACAC